MCLWGVCADGHVAYVYHSRGDGLDCPMYVGLFLTAHASLTAFFRHTYRQWIIVLGVDGNVRPALALKSC